MGKFIYRLWLFFYQIAGVITAGALFQFATDGAFDWPWAQQWLLYGLGFSFFVEIIEFFVRLKRRKSVPVPEDLAVQRQTLVKWNASDKAIGEQSGKLVLGEEVIALSNAEQTHLIRLAELEAVERKKHFMPPARELILKTASDTFRIKAWHPSWFDVKGWEALLNQKIAELPEPEPVEEEAWQEESEVGVPDS